MLSASSKTNSRKFDAWFSRLQQYFRHYVPSRKDKEIRALTARVIANEMTWKAILSTYGPELDPPFDKPEKKLADPADAAEQFQHYRGSREEVSSFWEGRLLRFYAHYDPSKTEAQIHELVESVDLAHWNIVWEMIVERYGPEPPDDLSSHVQKANDLVGKKDAAQFAVNKAAADAVERAQEVKACQERQLFKIRIARHFDSIGGMQDGRRD